MSLDPTGTACNRWKVALNAFDISFDGRLNMERSAVADNLCPSGCCPVPVQQ
jgi:hypothetical protein